MARGPGERGLQLAALDRADPRKAFDRPTPRAVGEVPGDARDRRIEGARPQWEHEVVLGDDALGLDAALHRDRLGERRDVELDGARAGEVPVEQPEQPALKTDVVGA